jgi:hypothetical protein
LPQQQKEGKTDELKPAIGESGTPRALGKEITAWERGSKGKTGRQEVLAAAGATRPHRLAAQKPDTPARKSGQAAGSLQGPDAREVAQVTLALSLADFMLLSSSLASYLPMYL